MMEITVEKFEQEINDLKEGQQKLEQKLEQRLGREIAGVKETIAAAQVKITQWVVGLFVGAVVIIATLAGVYLSALLLMAR